MKLKFALLKTNTDVHSLGITTFQELLWDCGIETVLGNSIISDCVEHLDVERNREIFKEWLANNKITSVGFSYRLDPDRGVELFSKLAYVIQSDVNKDRANIKTVYFAGLPKACEIIRKRFANRYPAFDGNETSAEILSMLGVPREVIPEYLYSVDKYDKARQEFGNTIVSSAGYLSETPRSYSYPEYGTKEDSLNKRLICARKISDIPLFRSHAGPYLQNRKEAVEQFKLWTKELASAGYLDILSIGTSQLTQEHFGESWNGLANGGGVPLNSEAEFCDVWNASRPMLVRTYAGTKNILKLAQMYDKTINMAWHALSFWWFCQIDGRGTNSVYDNLTEHFDTIRYIAQAGKPFEANVPHHFAFRGSDDLSYIVSAYLCAKAAKSMGIKTFVLQIMLNTPKETSGIQDLSKARVVLRLLKTLESEDFHVVLQTRTGLNYLLPNMEKAKRQLASVTALMDDIDPHNCYSPQIIHVVGYSEALSLADPKVINESIQITQCALKKYRQLRKTGQIDDMSRNYSVIERESQLYGDALLIIEALERNITELYTPFGFYKVLLSGILPLPNLWSCREEFANAAKWKTKTINGATVVVDEKRLPVSVQYRIEVALENLKQINDKISKKKRLVL